MVEVQQEMQTGGGPAGALPFIYGHPDPEMFPVDELRAAADEALGRYSQPALNYGVERGCGLLLEYLRARLQRDEGLPLSGDNLMLTMGASGALDAIVRLYTRPGDTVLVEAPSFHEALAILRDHPIRLAAVPQDDEGLVVEALAQRLEALDGEGVRPRLLYAIPSFQNPSGVTLSAGRRPAVLELARRYRFLVIEDDVYRDLAFGEEVPPSLYALDDGEMVIRLGSFSKVLAPGLRLGWVVAAPPHVARLAGSGLTASGGGANPFAAYVTAVFCQRGWLEPHVARLVDRYQLRRDTLLAALEAEMPAGVRWTRPAGGFFLWLTLPPPLRAGDVLAAAQGLGVTFLTGEPFFAEGGGHSHIRLPFSFVSPPDLERGVRILAGAIRRQIART